MHIVKRTERGLLLAVALLSLGLAACAPMTPAPTGESWPKPPPPAQPQTPKKPAEPIIRSGKTKEVKASQSAVTSLMNQGWRYYRDNDFDNALSVAERAQRIDARSPEVYLLMASSQFSLYQIAVAEQLARKGLALTQGSSAIKWRLQSLLTKISNAK